MAKARTSCSLAATWWRNALVRWDWRTKVVLMSREDWLLVFLYHTGPPEPGRPLDPIRIMKGLFLVTQRLAGENIYTFQPYNYGPCSFEVYQDLRSLQSSGDIKSVPTTPTWSSYQLTPQGWEHAVSRLQQMNAAQRSVVSECRQFVESRGFRQLLRDVYTAYPSFATRSLFSELAKR